MTPRPPVPAHTPGPWTVALPGGPQGRYYGIVSQHGYVVALQVPREEDARLMIAAPDLLAALGLLVRHLRAVEHWPTKAEHPSYLQMAEQAIAKAEAR